MADSLLSDSLICSPLKYQIRFFVNMFYNYNGSAIFIIVSAFSDTFMLQISWYFENQSAHFLVTNVTLKQNT